MDNHGERNLPEFGNVTIEFETIKVMEGKDNDYGVKASIITKLNPIQLMQIIQQITPVAISMLSDYIQDVLDSGCTCADCTHVKEFWDDFTEEKRKAKMN